MQDDFDRNDPAEETEEELPPGMHIVDEDEEAIEEDGAKKESPLNLNEDEEKA